MRVGEAGQPSRDGPDRPVQPFRSALQQPTGARKQAHLPLPRPTPALVGETVRALKQSSSTVASPVLASALRERTGCSRAGAYRAIQNAFEAGAIGWS